MIELQTQITSVAQVIQLAVAPVFLLAGVGSTLAVLTNRLARIIDRFHFLETVSLEGASPADRAKDLSNRISLSRRSTRTRCGTLRTSFSGGCSINPSIPACAAGCGP